MFVCISLLFLRFRNFDTSGRIEPFFNLSYRSDLKKMMAIFDEVSHSLREILNERKNTSEYKLGK